MWPAGTVETDEGLETGGSAEIAGILERDNTIQLTFSAVSVSSFSTI